MVSFNFHHRVLVNRIKYSLVILILIYTNGFGQKKERPYRGGFVTKDSAELRSNFKKYYQFLRVKKGERVASIGASNGYVEVQIAAFTDSVHWTLQDIDTARLNTNNFNKVLHYHEKLKGEPITGDYNLVIGSADKINLTNNFFDRILLINVYHELSNRKSILKDIHESLKSTGELVVMERMGTKQGQTHGDCKLSKLLEPDFIEEMRGFGFKMTNKEIPNKKLPLTFYTFKSI